MSNPLHSVLGDPVQVSQADHVLEVVLDRPKANAIDAPTSRRLGDIFQAFRDDSDLRVAIVTGDDDFGVGGFAGLQELPKLNEPVIAAVNGYR